MFSTENINKKEPPGERAALGRLSCDDDQRMQAGRIIGAEQIPCGTARPRNLLLHPLDDLEPELRHFLLKDFQVVPQHSRVVALVVVGRSKAGLVGLLHRTERHTAFVEGPVVREADIGQPFFGSCLIRSVDDVLDLAHVPQVVAVHLGADLHLEVGIGVGPGEPLERNRDRLRQAVGAGTPSVGAGESGTFAVRIKGLKFLVCDLHELRSVICQRLKGDDENECEQQR